MRMKREIDYKMEFILLAFSAFFGFLVVAVMEINILFGILASVGIWIVVRSKINKQLKKIKHEYDSYNKSQILEIDEFMQNLNSNEKEGFNLFKNKHQEFSTWEVIQLAKKSDERYTEFMRYFQTPTPDTKKCPKCMIEIDYLATKCPYCTSDL